MFSLNGEFRLNSSVRVVPFSTLKLQGVEKMNKRVILILGIVALILFSFSLATAQKSAVMKPIPIPADKIGPVKVPSVTGAKDYCFLDYTDWIPTYYHNQWKYGDKVAIYFDPEECGFSANYPFQLTDVEFYLYDFAGMGACSLRFSVEVMCPDICDGPGIEIWKSQVYNIALPDLLTSVEIIFEDTVCLDKPFFFNVEYMSDYPMGQMPSLLFDEQVVDTCYQWVWVGQPAWYEWYDFWYPYYPPGWVLLGISGYCGEEQTDCGWWYWKPDTTEAPSGMPDFDQNQPGWSCYCGPTAVANCLWWFNAVPPGWTPPQLIDTLARYFHTSPVWGTYVDTMQMGLDEYFADYGFALTETTYWMPDFYEMEDSLKVCQDIILLLGFWWWEEGTEQEFIRGDVNEDGLINIQDYAACLNGPPFSCDDAADVNDDGVLDNLDCDYLYNYLYLMGPPPPPPFPDCGLDPTPDALGCTDYPECPGGGGGWYREGGHFVTMAGVNSEKKEIAISDPDRDRVVQYPWWPGRVRPTTHPPWGGYPPTLHNNPTFVSHDVYISLLYPEFPSPGSEVWDLADYCYEAYKYANMNVPERFRAFTKEAPKHYEYWHVEVDAAVMICPKEVPNHPPEIGQPDFLEGYVDSLVEYDITGTDPDGDVILDEASIDIQPGCGNYSIGRISGHGSDSGTWRVTWYTDGCTPCDTHMVIHDLTDEHGLVGYCTTWVHLSEKPSDSLWYWKPDTTDAPSGMPDFDQNQDAWLCYCGPTAVANCLWWYGAVPTGWTPPQLIDTLARYFHTSPVWGTYVDTMQMGLEQYFQDYGFAFKESTFKMPDFFEMEDSLKVCQDIILLLGFWWYDEGSGIWYREGGHYVTMAGVCSESLKIAISDPDRDAAVGGWPGRVRPPSHPPAGTYPPTLHNNPLYVSHDMYQSILDNPFPSPGNPWWEIDYPWSWPKGKFSGINVPEEFRAVTKPAPEGGKQILATEVDYAVMICPKPPPDTLRNHFKTWRIEPEPFWEIVFVQDQFMSDSLILDTIEFFSNPVRKDSFEIVDSLEHLTWYRAHGRDTLLEVEYSNQFETDTVRIDSVKYLLLPTAKEPYPSPESLDHYKAYRIKDPVAFERTLVLEDQFDRLYDSVEVIDSLKPIYFLTPALKDKPPPMFDSITHYVAYEIFPKRSFPLPVNTFDQFGPHLLQVDTSKFLLVPTRKLRAEPPPNDPPEIIQPDTLYGYKVCDTVIYTFDGIDPDGDPILDDASLVIEPSCGTYSVTRLTGHGTSQGTWEVTWETAGCEDSIYYKIIVDLTDNQGNTSWCTTYCHLAENHPPTIDQPDSLEGYVDDVVQYTITGADPDSDVIVDQASINIIPSCGVYSITRTSGHGGASGTWQITWQTDGCTACQTYLVIHDLTDGCDTSYCTTLVHLSSERECDELDPKECDTLWVECGDMLVPPGGGLVTVDLTIAYDESLMAIVVPLSYEGSPECCDSMPESENTVAKVFAGSVVPGTWLKFVNIDPLAKKVVVAAVALTPPSDCLVPGKGHLGTLTLFGDSCCTIQLDTTFYPPTNNVGFVDCHDPTMTLFYPVCRIDTCHIDREQVGWHWKDSYEDYAPNGMPDIDQKQDNWMKEDQFTFCGPCAVANCFKWFDSKYNVPPGFPGDGIDMFPLVRDYLDNNPPRVGFDDHDPWNVNHTATGWNPGIGSPPSTPQPFVPGPQTPNQVPSWGELVERLAWYFDTDGIQSGYCNHTGTNVMDMQAGIQDWLESEHFHGAEQMFVRGDVNEDGSVDNADVIACQSGGPFSCDDAADVNDDGALDMADCVYLVNYLYGGPAPPSPFPDCGVDLTPDALGCADFPPCPFSNTLADTLCWGNSTRPTFAYVESLVEKCEDVILLLGFWFEDPPGSGEWWRVGGHYVTVAGVNSEQFKIAFSDPFIDAAELGFPGRVGDGSIISHPHGQHDDTVHNDEGNVSHDIYFVSEEPVSPGGIWWLPDYAEWWDPAMINNFFAQNVPDEFVPMTAPWNEMSPIYTEVEYCVHISPWDYRGDINIPNGDGVVDIGDVVFLINFLYKGGNPPVPFIEGDVNCDGVIDLGDIVFLINYLFKNGDVPRCCDP